MKTIEFKKTVRSSSNIMSENFSGTMVLIANVLSTNQELVQVSKFSSSAYESQVTIKTLFQSENRPTANIVGQKYKCHTFLESPGQGLSTLHQMGSIYWVILNHFTYCANYGVGSLQISVSEPQKK